jgi:hypothetical protein
MNNQPTVEQLEAELAALEPKAQTIPAEPEPNEQIADNDPALEQFGFVNGVRHITDPTDALYFKLNPMTLADGKAALARRRAAEKLIIVAKDRTRPTAERVAALSDIYSRGLPWPYWTCCIPAAEVRGLTPERILNRLNQCA